MLKLILSTILAALGLIAGIALCLAYLAMLAAVVSPI